VRGRSLTLLILLYVALDLSSPFVPGVFNFNPDESLEVGFSRGDRAAWRVSGARDPGSTPPAEAVIRPAGTATTTRGRSRAVNEWLVAVKRSHAPVPEAHALSEDH
jgi:hypothetical protein